MNKLLIALSLFSSIFISSKVLSDELKNDTDAFKELNLGIGLSILKYNSGYGDNYGVTPTSDNVNYRSTNIVPRFDASYLFELNNKWLLGTGFTFDLSPFNGDMFLAGDNIARTRIRTTNHYSLYVSPFYAIDNSLSVFGKLSYQSSNIYAIWTCPESGPGSGCVSDHMRLDGVGFGLGAKKIISQNIYVQAEGEYVDYRDKNYSSSGDNRWWYKNNDSFSGTLSIGYHF